MPIAEYMARMLAMGGLLAPLVILAGDDDTLPQSSTEALEEVRVTARKREEPLLRTPVAISAFSKAEIDALHRIDIADLAYYVPNVEFDFTTPISGSTNNASVFIRGVGQTDFVPNKDPGVGIYLDGVYIARSVGSVLNLLDVEQVQVLRGPQGTLFGKNTVGGAISVSLARPSPVFDSALELTVGDDDRRDFRGYLNTPVTDDMAIRVSLGIFRRDGYLRRVLVGDRMGNDHEEVARLALGWELGNSLRADFSVDYSHADEQSTAAKIVSTDIRVRTSPYSIGDPETLFAGQFYNVLIGGVGPCPPAAPCASLPPLPAATVPYDRRWITEHDFTTLATGPNYSKHSILGANLTLSWSVSDVQVKSITGYRHTRANFGRDPDGSALSLIETEVWTDHGQVSQEFQLNGSGFGQRVDYVAGVFYLSETGKQRDFVPFSDETFRTYAEMGIPIQNRLLANGPDSINRIDSLAVFGEGSFRLSPRFELTAGLRWTSEDRQTVANTTQGGEQAVKHPQASMDIEETTGRLIFTYYPNDHVMAYASYSEGFKSGGFNHRLAIPPPPNDRLETPTRFEPEFVDSWEVGLKTSFWRDRGSLRLAAFHARYRDMQLLVSDLGVPRTINAAEGEINGLELESRLAPGRHWTIDLAYGYLNTKYTRLDENIPGAFGNPISFVPVSLDSKFVNSPRHNGSIRATRAFKSGDGSVFLLAVDLRYRDATANDAINTPELVQDDLVLLGASVSWRPTICACELMLFGENLTDETYLVTGTGGSGSLGSAELIMARPREWGLRVRYRFD